jgi:hypothetical protein
MWLVEIYRYHKQSIPDYQFIFDYKKDLIKELRRLGFKWSTFNQNYCNEDLWLYAKIEKIDKNKIEL